jgi:hypothetical protein
MSDESRAHRIEAVTYGSPGARGIQLVTECHEDGPLGRPVAKHREGVHRVCLTHPDLLPKIKELEAKQVEPTNTRLVCAPKLSSIALTIPSRPANIGGLVSPADVYPPVDAEWLPGESVEVG